ncbi:Yap3p [Sugiyamaella lignohabitans]|uniref:Yap3p n=1 Tax=Sugiyamaella lignohabitans TaxID=796027 RepID=A0A161HGD6_9ASCO|nr:Yap3p [Sugiyamaella lignohabitans]ANB11821.1 Yap3p [Sugiyamaella lignohabitans]
MSAFYYDQTALQAPYQKPPAPLPSATEFTLPHDPADPANLDWVECDKILSSSHGNPGVGSPNDPSPSHSLHSLNNNSSNAQFFINPLMPSPESSESGQSTIAPIGNGSYSSALKPEDEIMNGTSGGMHLTGAPVDDSEVKRKAQNRAAQRAFRERKEQRVRELEIKLAESEEVVKKLTQENQKLTQENTVLKTENQVLRNSHHSNLQTAGSNGPPAPQQATFPSHQFYASLLEGHEDGSSNDPGSPGTGEVQPSYIVYERNHGETMLGAGTVWQMLMEDPVMSAEDVDISFVVQYIKDKAVCDGYGPVYPLREVHEGIRLAKAEKAKSEKAKIL